jgi:hypothetical protein
VFVSAERSSAACNHGMLLCPLGASSSWNFLCFSPLCLFDCFASLLVVFTSTEICALFGYKSSFPPHI